MGCSMEALEEVGQRDTATPFLTLGDSSHANKTSAPSQMDLDTLESHAKKLEMAYIVNETRRSYHNCMIVFVKWLYNQPRYRRLLFSSTFQESMDASALNTQIDLLKTLVVDVENETIQGAFMLEKLTSVHFFSYVSSIQLGPRKLMMSRFKTIRASLVNLYREYGITMKEELRDRLHRGMKSVRRSTARALERGEGPVGEGKRELTFEAYRWLSLLLMHHGSFFQCFLVLSWNLACRASSCSTIHFSHIKWANDAMIIYFSTMKNDQTGDRCKKPRHIYANPYIPELCPILSLALYLASVRPYGSLFPGTRQYDRYASHLRQALKKNHEELKHFGYVAEDIGSHSCRKGAATYVSSGTTLGPSTAAIAQRCGWSLSKVLDTYLLYEAAGDQFVGRMLAGLPILSHEFSTLPPHFDDECPHEIILAGIHAAFGLHYDADLELTFKMLLASFVYHESWLRLNLESNGTCLATPLFQNTALVAQLKRHITLEPCRFLSKATGIPPHVVMLKSLQDTKQDLCAILPAMKDIIGSAFTENAVACGTVSRDYIDQKIAALVEQMQTLQHSTNGNSENSEEGIQERWQWSPYEYNGRFWSVPMDFKFPTCLPAVIFQLWMRGSDKHPPLRSLKRFPSEHLRKRFADLKYLMLRIEKYLLANNTFNEKPTVEECERMYQSGSTAIASTVEPQRPLMWQTVAKRLRTT